MTIIGEIKDFKTVVPLEEENHYMVSYPYIEIHEGEYLKDEKGEYILDEGYPVLNDNYDGKGKLTNKVFWHQSIYPWKPYLDYLKWAVGCQINDDIDNKIINEFLWKGNHVWLTIENQNNYASAYNLAINTKGKNLPLTFKFTKNNSPVYYQFNTVEELTDFYLSLTNHINNALQWGWNKKENVDWSLYDYK